jgi:ABC-type branched-subunit amino acid transport system substrate-binding protein
MNSSAKILLATLIVVIFGVAVWKISRLESGNKKIKIAMNVPLTGPVAVWSGQYQKGFQFGIEEACMDYGLDPRLFVLDAQDNQGKPDIAVTLFRSHEQSGFDVYLTAAAGPVNGVAPLVDETNKPHFIASFDTTITRKSQNRFRLMANSRLEVPLFVDYVQKKNATSVHFIALNYPNLESQYVDFLKPQLEKTGVTISRDVFEMDHKDFRSLVERAKDRNSDVLFVMGFSFHLQPLLEHLQQLGLTEQGRVVSNMDAVDLVSTDSGKQLLANVVFTCPYFDIPGKVPLASDWRKRYISRYAQEPTYVPAYAYDNAYLIVRSFKREGNVNAASLSASVPFDGINGLIDLDQYRDVTATVGLVEFTASGVQEIKDVKPLFNR